MATIVLPSTYQRGQPKATFSTGTADIDLGKSNQLHEKLETAMEQMDKHYNSFLEIQKKEIKKHLDIKRLKKLEEAIEKAEEKKPQSLDEAAQLLRREIGIFLAQFEMDQSQKNSHGWLRRLADFVIGFYPIVALPISVIGVITQPM
jgi:hypothetical protein